MARQDERIVVHPMTVDERTRLQEALTRAKTFREELRAERDGRPFHPVSRDIAAIREGCDEEPARPSPLMLALWRNCISKRSTRTRPKISSLRLAVPARR